MKTLLQFMCIALPLLVLNSCAHKATQASDSESAKFLKIVKDYSDASKKLDAYWATYFNIEEDLSKFGDYLSPENIQKGKDLVRKTRADLNIIRPELLGHSEKIAYDLFLDDLDTNIREFAFPTELLSVNQMGHRLRDYLDDSSPSLSSFPFDSVKHYEDFVKRADGFIPFVDRQIAVLRRGVKEKVVLSCPIAKKVPGTYEEGLEKDVLKHPFYRPVLKFPASFSAADQQKLKISYAQMVQEKILPGFKKFDQFFKKEYIPHCRSSYGISGLPRGKAWYKHAVYARTNLNKTADEIHQIGLQEVARIEKEIDAVKTQMGYKMPLPVFFKHIVKEPKTYFTSREETLKAFEDVRSRIEEKIPQLFSLKPKSDYKIVEAENPSDASASYRMPTEMMPFGRFVVNTINLKANTKYGVTTLSLHEAIPGHHFQLALQYEMKDLTEYQRKMYFSTAFAEGWGLYAEYLGREMGLFTDPGQMLGHLSDEMWRAVRLVVDTGIHAKGWSREKAINYMTARTVSDRKEVETEIDRYSVWPGQALAYKMGQLKIVELRRKAEQELGTKFDIKKFHQVVLGSGTVSLPVLEKSVLVWIQSEKRD